VCGLAVYLERHNIATIVIGLVRMHMELIQPPRALWVPFELGRPLGGWAGERVSGQDHKHGWFQLSVLKAALGLLDSASKAGTIEDFTEEDPGAQPDTQWRAPDTGQCESVTDEFNELVPHWERWQKEQGFTRTGLCGMQMPTAADYVVRYNSDNPAPNVSDAPLGNAGEEMSDILRFRFCIDDIKTYYLEAAMVDGHPSSYQLDEWFWKRTHMGRLISDLREQLLEQPELKARTVIDRLLVPGAWR